MKKINSGIIYIPSNIADNHTKFFQILSFWKNNLRNKYLDFINSCTAFGLDQYSFGMICWSCSAVSTSDLLFLHSSKIFSLK